MPEEYREPVENTLNYIKKRANCNDYEAAQIQLLMSEQSGQKKGYEYYCRYIAGQSTPEEDKADYYISLRKSWDKFLVKFANMCLEERAEAFTVSGSSEKAMEILNVAGESEFAHISEKTINILKKMESLGKEIESKSTTYLITHLSWTNKKLKELEDTSNQYFKKVILASNEYKILESQSDFTQVKSVSWTDKTDETENIEGDAYKVAVRGVDVLNASERKMTMQKTWQTTNRELTKLKEGGLIQLRVSPSKANAQIYKFLLIEKVNKKPDEEKPDSVDCLVLDIIPRDKEGSKIKLPTSEDGDVEYKEIKMLDYMDSRDRVNITVEDLKTDVNKSKFKWHILPLDTANVTKGPLFRVYDIDPTRLEERLKNILPHPQNLIVVVTTLIVSCVGLLAMFFRCLFSFYQMYLGNKKIDSNNIEGDDEPLIPDGKGIDKTPKKLEVAKKRELIATNIGLLLASFGAAVGSILMVIKYDDEKNKHKNQTKELLKDIWKHNNRKN